jgi:Signal transduction histidine kinase
MKIKTQSFILMTGIVLMPILVISLFFTVERASFRSREAKRFEELKLEDPAPSPEAMVARVIAEKPEGIDMAVAGPGGKILWSSIDELPAGADFGSALVAASRRPMPGRILAFGFAPPMPEGYSTVTLLSRSSFLPSEMLEDYIRIGVVALGAILLFAATMSIIMLRSITRSVLSLESATKRVASGELDLPIAVEGASEISSLSRSLNSLREQIKEDQARRARFIMGISHDLKTPLALVKGYAEALEEELGDAGPTARAHLGIIQSKADQLEGMIEDLIDFERVDTGEWSRGLKRLDLGAFLRAFCRRVEADATLLSRAVEARIDLPEGASVMMDERLVTRALENLVNNALRYGEEGCHVLVAAWAEDAVGEGGLYRILVADDGPGIGPEDLPHVFEPFYRGSSSRREQGMGLGLSIVKTVVESHGWSIEARPREGRGVEFEISIPHA